MRRKILLIKKLGCGKLFSPLATSAHDNRLPTLGIHSFQKPVATRTLSTLRLVCFLRHTLAVN